MWKWSYQRAAVYFGFVFSFHEEGQQLPFSFDKYWSPSNEAKVVLFQDVIAVLDHLWAVIVRKGTRWKTKLENEIHFTLLSGVTDYLDVSHHSSRLHPAGDIHSVAPDVIVRLTSSYHSSQNSSFIETWMSGKKSEQKKLHRQAGKKTRKRTNTEHEVVEGLVVEIVQRHFHCQGKICQVREMLPALNQWSVLWLYKRQERVKTGGQNLGAQTHRLHRTLQMLL